MGSYQPIQSMGLGYWVTGAPMQVLGTKAALEPQPTCMLDVDEKFSVVVTITFVGPTPTLDLICSRSLGLDLKFTIYGASADGTVTGLQWTSPVLNTATAVPVRAFPSPGIESLSFRIETQCASGLPKAGAYILTADLDCIDTTPSGPMARVIGGFDQTLVDVD